MAGANVSLKDLPPYLPKAFIAIEDRRFYSHYGVDPLGIAARGGRQRAASRRLAGRLDADPAARQEPVSDAGAHAAAEIAGSRTRALAGAQAFQDRRFSNSISTGSISAPAPMASRPPRSAISAKSAQERHAGGGRDARGPRQVAVAAGAEPQSGRRREARPDRAGGDGGRQIHHRSAGAGLDRASLLQCEGGGRRHHQLCGGLDRRSARRSRRPDRPEHRGRNHDRSETAERRRSLRDRRTRGQKREVQCQPGRAGGDDAGWRGARHGRRPQLCREPVQPRGDRQAPAGFGVQAVRLSHRDRSRALRRRRSGRTRRSTSRAGSPRITATNISAR